NAEALKTLVDEHGVKLRTFPDDVMSALHESSKEVLQKQIDSDEASRRVYDSYRAFQQKVRPFTDVGEFAYLKARDKQLG
ncbi:ABC transporter substrate-binding protein, partial [Halomonas elongata]|nr:ABC transporter substrate-binding protein [Halomonas elongata]